jgi:glycine/D-amino acid oxidase-like deaminating enzyme
LNTLPYPDYQRRCGWNALLPPRRTTAPLAADISCDVAVIGAGYTGLAAARRCAELAPQARVVVLDASQVGEGNPGRNSGFMLDISLANDAQPEQLERMIACNRLIAATMSEIRTLVDRFDIDCGLVREGTYRAAAGSGGIRALRRYRDFLEAAGLSCQVLDQRELRKRIGTDFYQQGFYSPNCYLVQPAALIRGLADNLPPTVTLSENTPAVSIERTGGDWTVRTPNAAIRTPRLILANNAFSKRLGIGRSRLTAIYTYAALTDPMGPKLLKSLGDRTNWGLLPAHRLGSTLRRTADGRLLIRSLYGYEKEADNDAIGGKLRQLLQHRYPQLHGVGLASVWSGATGFTLNGAPLWGRYAPGLFVSAGCNGGDIVKGTLFGNRLAELIFGRESPEIPDLFGAATWMPPEPLKSIGFRILSGIGRYRGRAEM